jgi:uncharacterized repeat protein (TIGR03803 family)
MRLIVRGFAVLAAMLSLTVTAFGANKYKILYEFKGTPDGNGPADGVVLKNGKLYGATNNGGTNGQGTIYELSHAKAGWEESVLYSFAGGNDGDGPFTSAVIFDTHGNLYGTTVSGGNDSGCGGFGCGTVYELTQSSNGWTEKVLYSFTGGSDGAGPIGGLIVDGQGNLFGTTSQGGYQSGACANENGCGTVFELSPNSDGSWTEKTLYAFTWGNDGLWPLGVLAEDGVGHLYGTTELGGGTGCQGGGCGTVFRLTRHSDSTWTEDILYAFSGGSDGAQVNSGLVRDKHGNLYGMTSYGGTAGLGNVFELKPSNSHWKEKILHSFVSGNDGEYPGYGHLILDAAGSLYGTTTHGGVYSQGTVFKLTPKPGGHWIEHVIHSFGLDGYNVYSGVTIDKKGNLYGVLTGGGNYASGLVYEITP